MSCVLTALLLGTLGFAWMLWSRYWPHTNCPACAGNPRDFSPTGKNWRLCKTCGGKGSKIRIGARIWHRLRGKSD